MSVATITDAVGDVFDYGMNSVATVATTIVGSPILLIFASLSLVGLGVGLFKRLFRI